MPYRKNRKNRKNRKSLQNRKNRKSPQNRKKSIVLLAAVLCLASFLLAGCGMKKQAFTELSQMNDSGISIAMWSGSPSENTAKKHFPKAEQVLTAGNISMIMANLRGNKVDAAMVSKVFYDTYPNKDGLRLLSDGIEKSDYVFFFAKNEKGMALRDQMNEFVKTAEESGLNDELARLWLGEKVIGRPIGAGCDDPDAPELVFAAEYETPPFGYMEGDRCIGYDVDFADCFCREYGYRLKVVGLPFSMIASGDVTGEYDFAGGALLVDEELLRSKVVSEPHYSSPFVVIVCDEPVSSPLQSSIKDSFYNTFAVDRRWKLYVNGLLTTLAIFLVSAVFGTLLGFLVYLLGIRFGRGFRRAAGVIFTVLHITPTVVLLMIFYHLVFHGLSVSGLAVSVVVFILLMTGTVYDLMDSSVKTVDRGQTEGAIALGCTPSQAFFKVVMPQAMRHFLPIYRGELVGLIKATSVVGYIAVQDLTKVSDIIQTRTFDAFFPLFSAAVIYILLAVLLIRLVNHIFRKTDPKNRDRESIVSDLAEINGGTDEEGREASK